MRLGIRLQLLLALGSLLVLAFVPLFFAVASLTRATLASVRADSARALGRAVSAHLSIARTTRSSDQLADLLDAQVGTGGVAAVGLYDERGVLAARAGEVAALPERVAIGTEQVVGVRTVQGSALLVVVPDADAARGSVATVLRTDSGTVPTAPLVRLVGLYTVIVGLALLVFTYLVMTRLVVRPVDQLEAAARRVAEGGRRLEVPRIGARELGDLGTSLAQMTERVRADEEALRSKVAELERTTDELRRAQERLVRSERLASVGRLSAGLAHEIGNPIAAILGLLELLRGGDLDETERKDFLARVTKETERVHRVLRDLLDFARPAVRDARGEDADPGSVADAVRDVIALVAPQKTFKDVSLESDVAEALPAVAMAHERIVQVVLNLVLNAGDAVTPGKGHVVVRARADGECVRIEVEDDGPGVAPQVQERLFEPFVTTKEVGKGTGLGLAVCRGLVEAAGGTIAALESPLGGARFVIELPTPGAAPRSRAR